ncbi:hypothetical protein C8F04DRAFT_1191254 [Mycena alexandri]|uniref:Uncharacterized protein n=1 Tax=Mycena alexandri TaxID=1745969 RepID=A0AAD6SGI8_9AGAR|nr:hypothetical protein C8F04DRAFT_1191254 [Mycena alexandri]
MTPVEAVTRETRTRSIDDAAGRMRETKGGEDVRNVTQRNGMGQINAKARWQSHRNRNDPKPEEKQLHQFESFIIPRELRLLLYRAEAYHGLRGLAPAGWVKNLRQSLGFGPEYLIHCHGAARPEGDRSGKRPHTRLSDRKPETRRIDGRTPVYHPKGLIPIPTNFGKNRIWPVSNPDIFDSNARRACVKAPTNHGGAEIYEIFDSWDRKLASWERKLVFLIDFFALGLCQSRQLGPTGEQAFCVINRGPLMARLVPPINHWEPAAK